MDTTVFSRSSQVLFQYTYFRLLMLLRAAKTACTNTASSIQDTDLINSVVESSRLVSDGTAFCPYSRLIFFHRRHGSISKGLEYSTIRAVYRFGQADFVLPADSGYTPWRVRCGKRCFRRRLCWFLSRSTFRVTSLGSYRA